MAAIVDHYGRPYPKLSPAEVRAKFDLAQTNSHNKNHWANADSLAARASMTAAVRNVVVKRSRHEADNNSWYTGMLRTASNHIVGCGPRLQVTTLNTEGNARLERAWKKWSRAVMLGDKLRTMLETYWKDGQVYAMRSRRPSQWPISLDVRLYETEQCAAPWIGHRFDDPYETEGIRTDPNWNAIEFYFYDHHPGDTGFFPTLEGSWYPADQVIQLFRRERPGQVHGIPRATSSLQTLPIMRRQEIATLLASETAASFATYLKSTSGPIVQASPQDFAEVEIAFNMLTTLPEGWDIAQVDGKHPGPQYEMFQRQALMSFARCTNMPLGLAIGTSKDSNFSGLKGDMINLWQPEVICEQDRIELAVVEKIWGWFLEDAVYVRGLLDGMPAIDDIDHEWTWQPLPNLDEKTAADSASIRLKSGQSTLSDEHSRAGGDYNTRIVTMAADLDVTVPEMKAMIKEALFPDPTKGAGAMPGFAAAEAEAPTGEYTEIGQQAWNNNQKRILRILESFQAEEISESRARLALQSIGLTQSAVDGYIEDALNGVPDAA